MSGRKIDTSALLGWAGVSILILAVAPIAKPVREFATGLLGSPTETQPASIEIGALRAELSDARPEMAYAVSPPQAPQYAPGIPALPRSDNGLGLEASTAYGTGSIVPGGAPIGARGSIENVYGSESASRAWLNDHGSTGSGVETGSSQVGIASPVILNRAGPGTYSDGSGDIYAQAGPHGVVNTRTGEFSPTN